MTPHSMRLLPATLALFLLMIALSACDSAPEPVISTPIPVSPTTTLPAPQITPDQATAVAATPTIEEVATPQALDASPTTDVSISPPVPTDTEEPTAKPTRNTIATATHTPRTTATTIAKKHTATPVKTTSTFTYIFPVQPPDVTNYGQYHHDYPATDIFCPIGSKFVAPIDGVVDYVSYKDIWDPAVDDPASRGGLSVAIIGVDGVRYYGSHLSKIEDGIAPGIEVKSGELLGRTGKTGDARFVDPHLHFGISHPTTPDDWEVRRGEISPYKYLQAWQEGKMLKPEISP